jgi:hypothetical protein
MNLRGGGRVRSELFKQRLGFEMRSERRGGLRCMSGFYTLAKVRGRHEV